jgi:gliding motility-associated-like protein
MHKENFLSRCGNLFLGLLMLLAFSVKAQAGINDPLLGCTNPMACNYNESATDDDGSCFLASPFYPDTDADGFGNMNMEEYYCDQPVGFVNNPGDCDDSNSGIYLGAAETCNQLDDDCDGELDNGVTNSYYLDADADGFGWIDNVEMACEPPLGYVSNSDDCDDATWMYADVDGDGYGYGSAMACGDVTIDGDCNDNDPSVFLITAEICNGLDEDCDGEADNGVTNNYYIDADGDGFGSDNDMVVGCDLPLGYVTNLDDCDDATYMYADLDGDGFGSGVPMDCGDVTVDGDCDDGNIEISPASIEICGNDIDEDCNGSDQICTIPGCTDINACNYSEIATQEDGSCSYPETDYLDCNGNCISDTDIDGICDELEVVGCIDPSACNYNEFATDEGACNYPQVETCNGLDEDCDGEVDEFVTNTYFADADGDGFGNASETIESCDIVLGYVENAEDCNDLAIIYEDQDGDGYGIGEPSACGSSDNNLDCADGDNLIFPGASELCGNDTDEDCDGLDLICPIVGCTDITACNYDEIATENDGSCFYPEVDFLDCDGNCLSDVDGDGICDEIEVVGCIDPSACNYNEFATDEGACNYPQVETCNGLDDDCDVEVDEFVTNTYFADADGDGFGNASETIESCDIVLGYVENADDCDDSVVSYEDQDDDGFGAGDFSACGLSDNNLDCADSDNLIFPGAFELCGNDIDEDCDGLDLICSSGGCMDITACNYDETATENDGSCFYPETDFLDCDGNCLSDVDGDGICDEIEVGGCTDELACDYNPFATDAGLCTYPQAEICNGLDDDCDGDTDNGVLLNFYLDFDMDGFGNPEQVIFACQAPTGYVDNLEDCDDNQITFNDSDGDGYGSADAIGCGVVLNNSDCDDDNASIHPDAVELCNNVDEDCDEEVDEFVTSTFYLDADGDGFGNPSETIESCEIVLGYVANADDCDDALVSFDDQDGDGFGVGLNAACGTSISDDDCNDNDALINPGMVEQCNDIDDDCDIEVDEFVTATFYADVDGDGFGNPNSTANACLLPQGFVENADDCDDSAITYDDLDGDGFGSGESSACGTSDNNTDCNDADNAVYPEANEICNLSDDDCDEEIDEFVTTTYYLDADGDGFGTDITAIEACELPIGYVTNFDDCDDNTLSYEDMDGDGFGAGNSTACGSSISNTDCNDADGAISPGTTEICGDGIDNDCLNGDSICQIVGCMDEAACNYNPLANIDDLCIYASNEVCDSIDNDCDGEIDEFVTSTFYVDLDGDGFGNADSTIEACSLPLGFVSDNTDCDDSFAGYEDLDGDGFGSGEYAACGTSPNTDDCDDTSVNISPSAIEICNSLDDDCDLEIDEFVTLTFYADVDGDGFGNQDSTMEACTLPIGFVSDNTDCDDNLVGYDDLDGDTYGFGQATACGTALNNEDCDDASAAIAPNVQEICNLIDDNCDGEIDENVLVTYYLDADADGFGDPQITQFGCSPIAGYVSNPDDCDDALITYQDNDSDGFGGLGFDACGVLTNDDCNENDNTINPGTVEICGNDVDENCNGLVNEDCAFDADGDGYSNLDDCDDNNAAIYPDQVEICNGIDDNCNNLIDDNLIFVVYYVDQDIDGYGTSESDTLCQAPTVGFATETGDCDDADANINPGVTEAFNGIDDNCDGVIDEDMIDTDGDGVENGLDADDDNDGLLDDVEDDFNGDGITGDDCDNDGIPNTLDADACDVFIPEGFSPNNDGVNEAFEIQQLPYGAVVELEVYNRWGALVYESSDYKNTWKGVNNDDEELPSGVYYYVVRIANKGFEKTNPLTIWR